MEPRCVLIAVFACALFTIGSAAPGTLTDTLKPVLDLVPALLGPASKPESGVSAAVAAPSEHVKHAAEDETAEGLVPVVIPEHVHLVDKRSPTKKFGYGGGGYGGGYGGHGGGGYGGYPGGGGGGCNVCGGGGGGYPIGGGGYGGGNSNSNSYSQSSSSSQSSSGSNGSNGGWGKK